MTPEDQPKAREFWLRQQSQDGGVYSDIRVMKPSDCDLGERPPSGHDKIKYYEVVHVIEKSAFDELMTQAKALADAANKLTSKVVAGISEAEQGGFRSVPLRNSDFVELADALTDFRTFIKREGEQ